MDGHESFSVRGTECVNVRLHGVPCQYIIGYSTAALLTVSVRRTPSRIIHPFPVDPVSVLMAFPRQEIADHTLTGSHAITGEPPLFRDGAPK